MQWQGKGDGMNSVITTAIWAGMWYSGLSHDLVCSYPYWIAGDQVPPSLRIQLSANAPSGRQQVMTQVLESLPHT